MYAIRSYYVDVPSRNGGDGPRAEVSVDFGGTKSTWEGRVTRMEAQVDQSSRMVHVVVEVDDPYDSSEGHPALLPRITSYNVCYTKLLRPFPKNRNSGSDENLLIIRGFRFA